MSPSPTSISGTRTARGALAQFGCFCEAHRPRLFGLAFCLTRSAAEAEDAVQETFLHALRARRDYEERECGGGWLSRILLNVVRDGFRRRSRERRLQAVAAWIGAREGAEVDVAADPERAERAAEALEAALTAITELPGPFRDVLLLRRVEGLSTAEVAHRLELPEATVRTRLKRASDRIVPSVHARRAPRPRACRPRAHEARDGGGRRGWPRREEVRR